MGGGKNQRRGCFPARNGGCPVNKDLTVGNPTKVLWLFCLPLFGSILFQQLYNIADSFVAGKFIGENALAAVGNSYEITLIFLAFAFGCNIGCSVIVSQFFGAKRYDQVKTTVYTAFLASGVVCLVLMAMGFFGCRALLGLIHTPVEILEDSTLYLDIYVLGLPFVFFYNISTGIFSALGDSKTPFWFLAVSSVSNIAADVWFVKGLGMGVDGVAWATFLCQGVSCVLAMVFVLRRLGTIPSGAPSSIFDWGILVRIAKIAIPSTLQQSFISVGNIVIQGIINGFGPAIIAGYAASVKLNNLVITSFTTIGNGLSNYTAQNLGAENPKRVKQGFRAGLSMIWILAAAPAMLYFLGGRALMPFFIESPTPEALTSGALFLRILSPFYFVVSAKLVADGILRGSGRMKQFMIGTFTDLVLRVGLAALLSRTALGATGIWCAWPIGWIVAAGLSIAFYRQIPAEQPEVLG